MLRTGKRLRIAAALFALLLPGEVLAEQFVLLGGFADALNHYPGADNQVPTGDDVVSARVTMIGASDPNFHGDYSFVVFPISVSFLEGTTTIDLNAGATDPLVTALDTTGTGIRQGLPLTRLRITAVNSGSLTTINNLNTDSLMFEGTQNVDLEATLDGGIMQTFSGVDIDGTAFVVDDADYAAFNADAYVDNVLIPIAQAAGATKLLFLQAEGMLIAGLPLVLNPSAFDLTLVGLAGVPAANQADLEITKTVVDGGTFMPGDTVVFRLTVTNNGPANASGVLVSDTFVPQIVYQSDDCGAGAPDAEGTFSWSIGTLNSGDSAVCNVTVELAADANFDQENGATVVSTTVDSDLTNNTGRVVVTDFAPGVDGLAQPSNQEVALVADAACGICVNGSEAKGDNFKINTPSRVTEIAFIGGYSNNVPFADDFTIQIFDNNDVNAVPGTPDVPGELVATVTGPVTRTPTGTLNQGFFNEFEYRVGTNVSLERGSYWVVIYNDSSAAAGDWFWSSGDPDPDDRSCRGVASNPMVPLTVLWEAGEMLGSPPFPAQLALEVETVPLGLSPTPALGRLPLLALAALLLLLGAATFRRRRGKRRAAV
jgi:uncharacterized repeat protein (TIGR01451 family)